MVYCRLGEVYMNLGNLDEAYKFYQKTFELKPMPRADHAFCATNFGVVLERRGDRAGSCRIWRVGCNAGSQVSCGNLNGC
jgi:tetratricopeptide (TPR) repeat protein